MTLGSFIRFSDPVPLKAHYNLTNGAYMSTYQHTWITLKEYVRTLPIASMGLVDLTAFTNNF